MNESQRAETFGRTCGKVAKALRDSGLPYSDCIAIIEMLKVDMLLNSGAVQITGEALKKVSDKDTEKYLEKMRGKDEH